MNNTDNNNNENSQNKRKINIFNKLYTVFFSPFCSTKNYTIPVSFVKKIFLAHRIFNTSETISWDYFCKNSVKVSSFFLKVWIGVFMCGMFTIVCQIVWFSRSQLHSLCLLWWLRWFMTSIRVSFDRLYNFFVSALHGCDRLGYHTRAQYAKCSNTYLYTNVLNTQWISSSCNQFWHKRSASFLLPHSPSYTVTLIEA